MAKKWLRRKKKRPSQTYRWSASTRRRQFQKNLPGILILILFFILLLLLGYALYKIVLAPLYQILAEPDLARDWVAGFGIWGPLVFIGLNFLRVIVAFIPGEPFEIAAGFIFGPWLGTLVCVIGVTLGSVAAFMLTRIFGMRLLNLLFSEKAMAKLNLDYSDAAVGRTLFVLFIIPATPKDFLTYAAGLTNLPLWNWIAIVLLARFPSIVTSTFGGQAISSQNYGVAIGIFLAGSLFSILFYFLYERFSSKKTS